MRTGDGLSQDIVQPILDRLEPGGKLLRIEVSPGSFSNFTYFIHAETSQGFAFKFVIRIYNPENGGVSEKARREFQALELLNSHQLPCASPLLLDEDGSLLGSPGIVVSFVDGRQNLAPDDPDPWARSLAVTLANIHAIPCNPAKYDALLNANTEALWFLRYEEVPAFMRAHPDGNTLWYGLREKMMYLKPVRPSLIHLDFWAGNILWEQDAISAVVDWEEAAFGDPAVDVAHAYRDISSMGFSSAAQSFLHAYEAEMGYKVENLAFWSLASAVRQMPDPAAWIHEGESLGQEVIPAEAIRSDFRKLVAKACQELGI